ncbi:MAG: hypothetical protein WBP56_23395 [Polyangia bacterium]
MKKLVRLVLAAAVIGLAIWGWRAWFPSPQNAIRARLRDVARTASVDPGEGIIPRGLKAQRLGEYLTPDVAISLDVRGFESHTLQGRDEVTQAVLGAMQRLRGLKIEFVDINVTLDPGSQAAVVNLTGKATITGERDLQVQEFNFKLKKIDRDWLIYRIDTVNTLSQTTTLRPTRA